MLLLLVGGAEARAGTPLVPFVPGEVPGRRRDKIVLPQDGGALVPRTTHLGLEPPALQL